MIAGATVVELYPPRVERADVLVEGGAVAQVGGAMPEGVGRLDAPGCYVMPAFCNAHTHLYMSLTRGMPPPPSRPMTLADVPTIGELEILCFPAPWSPDTYRNELLHNRFGSYWVMEPLAIARPKLPNIGR